MPARRSLGDPVSTTRRPLRADAERNRQRLLDAARSAFARQGVDASLDDIARDAGVGSATLYRNFPTRDALILELMREGLDELEALAGDLAQRLAPGPALHEWLRAYIRHGSTFRGLAATLIVTDLDDDPSTIACHAVHEAGRSLYQSAVASGDADPHVDPNVVIDLCAGIAWVADQSTSSAETEHMLAIIIKGYSEPKRTTSN